MCETVVTGSAAQDITLNWASGLSFTGKTKTFLRLRLSTLQTEAEAATGNGNSIGEIEDYAVTVQSALDYDDAPASYGEAQHTIISGIQLGAAVTDETTAYDSADAMMAMLTTASRFQP